MSEENKTTVRRYMEQIWNQGRLDLFEEFVAADVVLHVTTGLADAETMRQAIAMTRNAFPDIHIATDDELAVDDKVVARWTLSGTHQGEYLGIQATGKGVVMSGVTIFRLAGGKIAEFWTQSDQLGLMQQLGAIPS